jgi:hypothetical protein
MTFSLQKFCEKNLRKKKEQGVEPCSRNCVDPIFPQ